MAAQPDPRILGPASQPDSTPFWSVLGLAQPDPTLLGLARQQDPTLLVHFESVLGLAWQPNPTILGLAAKPDPTAFSREDNASSHNSWPKTQ